jgi:DNA repair protein RadA/Sms
VSGEDTSASAMRAKRFRLRCQPEVELLAEINLEKILATLRRTKPILRLIPSNRLFKKPAIRAGSVVQVREMFGAINAIAR